MPPRLPATLALTLGECQCYKPGTPDRSSCASRLVPYAEDVTDTSPTVPGRPVLVRDAGFTEVADRVWTARHSWHDVNVTVVAGERGLLLVDTLGSDAAARSVLDGVRALGAGDVVAVVNTHEHAHHTFGNAAVRRAYGRVPVHAHEEAAARTLEAGRRVQRRCAAGPGEGPGADPHRDDVLATEIVPADHPFSSAAVVDLGDRVVELVHPGRGHTSGDLVVLVPDADVACLGDLVGAVDPADPDARGPR